MDFEITLCNTFCHDPYVYLGFEYSSVDHAGIPYRFTASA
jgi:hypothetical protein